MQSIISANKQASKTKPHDIVMFNNMPHVVRGIIHDKHPIYMLLPEGKYAFADFITAKGEEIRG